MAEDKPIYASLLAHLSNTFNMMDAAVIEDEHTMWGWIRVHYLQQTFQPVQKLFSVVTSCFDMAIDDPAGRNGQKHRIPYTTNKFSAFSRPQSLPTPAVLAI